MRRKKVILDFIKFSVAEKIEFFRNVIELLTGNPLFATPDVSLIMLKTMLDTLIADFIASKSGAHAMIARMNQSATALDKKFRLLALYVDRIADGDEAIILGSGFHASKEPDTTSRELFIAEEGVNSREIDLARKAQRGAKSYVWQYCVGLVPAKDEDWIFGGASSQATFTMKGLTSETKYWFRVAVVTTRGMGPWSTPIMKIVP